MVQLHEQPEQSVKILSLLAFADSYFKPLRSYNNTFLKKHNNVFLVPTHQAIK